MARKQEVASSTPQTGYSGLSRAAQIAAAVKRIYSAYRRDQWDDPELFVTQVGTVLNSYSLPVIDYISHPLTGIQIKSEFPPTLKQVKDACDEEQARRDRLAKFEAHPHRVRYVPPEIPNHPGCRCNLFVHADAPQYPALLAWSQSPQADVRDYKLDDHGRAGLWVSLSIFNDLHQLHHVRGFKTLSDAELRAHYGQREAKSAKDAALDGERGSADFNEAQP